MAIFSPYRSSSVFLWKSPTYVLLSGLLVFAVMAPLYFALIAEETQRAANMKGGFPFILLSYLLYFLFPQLIAVSVCNGLIAILRRRCKRNLH